MSQQVVLCAPNAFKGTLSAAAAAAAMAAGVRDAGGIARVLPMADGGDGTLDVLLAAAPHARVDHHRVRGPSGGRVTARLGWLDPTTAVVELAEASGLRHLGDARLPMQATTVGTGELLAFALDAGALRVVVGVGGSASTDGGAGLLTALGARLLDASGDTIGLGASGLEALCAADLTGLDPRLRGCVIDVAVDVDSALLGPTGAAAVFAPQKGASPDQVARLEDALGRLAATLERDAGVDPELRRRPGTGAAGGAGYALAVLGARLHPGAAFVATAVGLDAALEGCTLALTGEGRLDAQTARGKAPIEVATRAARAGVRCVAIAGSVEAVPPGFAAAVALESLAGSDEDPRTAPEPLLRRAAAQVTRDAGAAG